MPQEDSLGSTKTEQDVFKAFSEPPYLKHDQGICFHQPIHHGKHIYQAMYPLVQTKINYAQRITKPDHTPLDKVVQSKNDVHSPSHVWNSPGDLWITFLGLLRIQNQEDMNQINMNHQMLQQYQNKAYHF